MMASGSRPSGLDIPFLEMEPVLHDIAPAQDSYPDLATLEPGALIADRYRVLRKIAEGGMGILYTCEDLVLTREVAVKLMQRSIAADPQLSQRLLREARLAAQLRKHVAQVFDCGTLTTGEPYIVMELLHGRDLYTVLKESGPLSPERLTGYLLELCVGLAEAHEKGIIHRDLKPENLFCAEEPDGSTVLKIVDFGVSKQLTSRRWRSQTNPSESVGSPQYMSPEQITTPSEVDTRTDIWSLGVVMFELLTGNVPFNGAGPAQVCGAVLTQPVPPFSDYRDDVPPALESIVLRCLERDREQRFASVAELAAALSGLSFASPALSVVRASSSETASESDDDGDGELDLPRSRRARRWVGALCAVTVVGGCAAVLGLAVREGHIRLPSGEAVLRLPTAISAWRSITRVVGHRGLPFLSRKPEPAPAEPRVAPNETLEPPTVAPPAAARAPKPLTNVQVRTAVQAGTVGGEPAVAPAAVRSPIGSGTQASNSSDDSPAQ